MMRVGFSFRDHLISPREVLSNAGLQPGQTVLDFGCGPGSYTLAAARLVGPEGTVYAADCNPVAVRHVRRETARKGLPNVTTIHTSCDTGLPDGSVDAVLLYDIYHELEEPERVKRELHRVLRPDGLLSFSDHHMDEEAILEAFRGDALFRLQEKQEKTYAFQRKNPA
jgi:ubiquinone/menaquinone biosynthesis C-methylase UbiE